MSRPRDMRYPPGDPPILSAEIYDPGLPLLKRRFAIKTNAALDDMRKRAKSSQPESAEPPKRPRGRPRLETKDETAAERRRTQIRLAQRAYRTRKENAIHALEAKVEQLKAANEGMCKAFMQLHDFSVSSGLIDREPEFGRQLRETTERFLSFARQADEESPQGGTSKESPESAESVQTEGSSPERVCMQTRTTPDGGIETRLQCGLIITHEPATDHNQDNNQPSVSDPLADPTADSPSFTDITSSAMAPNNFPDPTALYFPTPWGQPRPIRTYAHLEPTFGRRLQRFALERALHLLAMPSPPEQCIHHVFGFCMLFEPRETIILRLRTVLRKYDESESLNYWGVPFYSLGGAGTHLVLPESDSVRRIGNQGMQDVLKPAQSAGFGAGPFDEKVESVRDTGWLDRDMRMLLPGFQGEWFDCDEVEMWLVQRGVVVPPGADYVEAEVDGTLCDAQAGDGLDTGTCANEFVGLDPISSSSSSRTMSPEESLGNESLLDLPLEDGGGASWGIATEAGVGESSLPFAGGMLPFGLDSSVVRPQPTKRKVVVDVTRLVKELTKRSICLGRSPGIRPKDIKKAFWASTQVRM